MSSVTGEEVEVERRGAVLVVTMRRPERRNAMNLAMARGIAEAMDLLDADDDLAAGVLTGAGGTFCSGMDLKGFAAGERPEVPGRGFGGLVHRPPAKPLIAAVEGHAVAGGFELVLACDLVVAARDASFGLPEVKRSIVPGGGGLLRLGPRVSGVLATELALTGRAVGAERLYGLGAINALAEPGGALDGAVALAEEIAANGPLAVRAIKRILREGRDWPEAEFWDRQAAVMDPVLDSEDALEGARAFVEKRAPRWAGR